MDLSALIGTLLGISAVLLGQFLEGGTLGQILQGTAALIVVGGTCGAMFLAFPLEDIRRAFSLLKDVYRDSDDDPAPLVAEIVRIAGIARKEGVLALEAQRATIQDPLFARSIKYVVDGLEPAAVRELLESEIQQTFERDECASKVFEGAGGYAPTIGILGAVLGLIHVMSMLNEPSKIGEGIAVAFVATIYGVGLANLVLLPWGNKIKRKAEGRMRRMEVVKLGIQGIQEGLNPNFLREKLETYV